MRLGSEERRALAELAEIARVQGAIYGCINGGGIRMRTWRSLEDKGLVRVGQRLNSRHIWEIHLTKAGLEHVTSAHHS